GNQRLGVVGVGIPLDLLGFVQPGCLYLSLVGVDDWVQVPGSTSSGNAGSNYANDSEAGDDEGCFGFEEERSGADDLIEKARGYNSSLCEIQFNSYVSF